MVYTDTPVPLGIGSIVSGTFAVLFRRFPLFLGLALLPSLLTGALRVALLPSDFGSIAPTGTSSAGGGLFVLSALAVLIWLLTVGALTLAAYDTRLKRPVRISAYLSRALSAAPAIVLLGVLLYIALAIGLMLLVVPGLYLMARYWVMAPAILVEGAGLRGLSRSAELTRGYRWPILGAVILMFLLTMVIMAVLGLMTGVGGALMLSGAPGTLVVLIDATVAAVQLALLSIFTALVYARLREIKEGLGIADLTAVFE